MDSRCLTTLLTAIISFAKPGRDYGLSLLGLLLLMMVELELPRLHQCFNIGKALALARPAYSKLRGHQFAIHWEDSDLVILRHVCL